MNSNDKRNKSCCPCPETLAMASVPMQEWCEPYDLDRALQEGTIFPCLNLEFFAAKDTTHTAKPKFSALDKGAEREKMMQEINTVSFAINDLTLYLDTHPTCPKGLSLFKELLERRLDLLAKYASKFPPLTQISMITGNADSDEYGWGEGPAPWEGGLI